MTKKWQQAVKMLEKVALASPGVNGHHLAAGIYVKKELVAVGWNRLKTDAFQMRYGKNPDSIYIHAEVDAIKRAIRNLSTGHYLTFQFPRSTLLVVVRANPRTGELKMSRPCPGCQRALTDFGISTILYTQDDGTTAQEDIV